VTWQDFVIAHGSYARGYHLAHVVQQPLADVERLRGRNVCVKKQGSAKTFAELFTLWRGRPPAEDEWPKPQRRGRGEYEWLGPELALLARLIGEMGPKEIAGVLTERLRQLTGDESAVRSTTSVQIATNRVGLQTTDVVGGITAAEAGRQIRSYGSVLHAIDRGDLPMRRVGRLMVIPHAAWDRWKSERPQPPKDYVRLAPVFKQLGISSDSKPQEFSMHIPTAEQFHPFGERGGTSRRGVWFVKASVARKLIADRRAGRPMPWHGKPNIGNLKHSWKLLQKRQHPNTCAECKRIFQAGVPTTFDDFVAAYPPLSHGDKRHLTREWNPGLTVKELAAQVGFHPMSVCLAIRNGSLRAKKVGKAWHITRTDATRWKARNYPSGDGIHSWISRSLATRFYGFSVEDLDAFVRDGRLNAKAGAHGQSLVSRQQCKELREAIGYTEAEAAKRCGLTVAKFRVMLRGLDVERRAKTGIRPDVIRNVQRRLSVLPGITFEAAAATLGKPQHWIRRQLHLGLIEVVRAKWDHKRLYLTKAAIAKLQRIAADGKRLQHELGDDWLMLQEAARHAGVTTGTIQAWAGEGDLQRRRAPGGMRYRKASIEERARRYWPTQRFKRATPPAWLQHAA
jgi:hypothetical protein